MMAPTEMGRRSGMVGYEELRKVLRLALDLRDLPRGSREQRLLAITGLAGLTGAEVALWLEIDGVTRGPAVIRDGLDWGWPSESERRVFLYYIGEGQHRSFDPAIPGVVQAAKKSPVPIFSRDQLVADHDWYRSDHVQEIRREAGIDSFIYATHVGAGDQGQVISLHKPWGRAPFGEHERNLVDAFYRECHFLHEAPATLDRDLTRGLSPRMRDTLGALARGLSEKQIAAELRISPHTVHEYVKALHRHFGVQSRTELLALCIQRAG